MLSGLHAAGKALDRDLFADARKGVVLGDTATLRTTPGADSLTEAKAVAKRTGRRRATPIG